MPIKIALLLICPLLISPNLAGAAKTIQTPSLLVKSHSDPSCRWLNQRIKHLKKQIKQAPQLGQTDPRKQELRALKKEWKCLKCNNDNTYRDYRKCRYTNRIKDMSHSELVRFFSSRRIDVVMAIPFQINATPK